MGYRGCIPVSKLRLYDAFCTRVVLSVESEVRATTFKWTLATAFRYHNGLTFASTNVPPCSLGAEEEQAHFAMIDHVCFTVLSYLQ